MGGSSGLPPAVALGGFVHPCDHFLYLFRLSLREVVQLLGIAADVEQFPPRRLVATVLDQVPGAVAKRSRLVARPDGEDRSCWQLASSRQSIGEVQPVQHELFAVSVVGKVGGPHSGPYEIGSPKWRRVGWSAARRIRYLCR